MSKTNSAKSLKKNSSLSILDAPEVPPILLYAHNDF